MDPQQLQPGYRLDRYELLCPLAYGGMASVWLARFGGRLGFERLVVVKMILPQYSQDPRFQEMFLDEAHIAARVEHTNVARILDVGENEGNNYIVMEWVDGDSLSKVMRAAEQRKQRVPPGVAMRVLADAAAGLHAAHALKDREGNHLGVVHRDVSPQNILISNAGATVIIDFGVAKARDRVSQETSAGQLKGKIRYMAPEQALGHPIDHRADVWALGAILYELFSGNPPYDGANEVATLHKLTSGAIPAPLPHGTPDEVQAIVNRALAPNPEDRYATALEMNLALENALVHIGEATSVAVVAHYTQYLLAERKTARKRAVDAALAAAKKRDTGTEQLTTGSHRAIPIVPPSSQQMMMPIAAISTQDLGSAPSSLSRPQLTPTPPPPSETSGSGSLGLGMNEVPSAASTATLGSAAIEYPAPFANEPPARRSRYIGVVLGISMTAGLIGLLLIVNTLRKHGDEPIMGRAPDPTSTIIVPVAEPPATTPPPAESTPPPPAIAATTPVPSATPAPTPIAPPPTHPPTTSRTPITKPPTKGPATTPPPKEGKWGF